MNKLGTSYNDAIIGIGEGITLGKECGAYGNSIGLGMSITLHVSLVVSSLMFTVLFFSKVLF